MKSGTRLFLRKGKRGKQDAPFLPRALCALSQTEQFARMAS